jgi:hypothetical protein
MRSDKTFHNGTRQKLHPFAETKHQSPIKDSITGPAHPDAMDLEVEGLNKYSDYCDWHLLVIDALANSPQGDEGDGVQTFTLREVSRVLISVRNAINRRIERLATLEAKRATSDERACMKSAVAASKDRVMQLAKECNEALKARSKRATSRR